MRKAAAVRNGPAPSVEGSLAAIKAMNGKLNAFNIVLSDEDVARTSGGKGPLAGLPVGVKDIIDVAGLPTGAGSLTRKGTAPAERDAFCVARLKAAGAVVVGKTNTVEYALGGWGTNYAVGTPRNPWDMKVARTPGGSSSGSGVAVSTGIVPAALGSDTGGSVRLPASWCGCVGLKTSIGLIGRSGVVPLSTTLDTVGPLTDTVRRAAELLAVMQGEDAADPSTHGVKRGDPLASLERGVLGLRIGLVGGEDTKGASPETRDALAKAAKLLAEAGASVVPFKMPLAPELLLARCGSLITVEAYATYRRLVDDPKSALDIHIRRRMLDGKGISAADLVAGEQERARVRDSFLWAMDRLDVILLPTTATTAIKLTEVDERVSPGLYTRFVNYLELCGLALPMGRGTSGLPTSVQIVGRKLDDPLVLRAGQALEGARGALPRPKV
ncbi:MAG: amidase [Bauldia sp.]|nr:MAG: amidase [Bauldia sp.]